MSLNLEGRKCVVCQSYLFEDDDVVFCPECGAPHHRDCYAAAGKCGMAELHGTAEQYHYDPEEAKKEEPKAEETPAGEKKTVCPSCSKEVDSDARFCPYCRAELSREKQDVPYPFAPPVIENLDEELEDGVTVREAAAVIAVNSPRYIEKFRALKKGRKATWNWAAFLVPHGWFAFRKMYLIAVLVSALFVAASLFSIPMAVAEASGPAAAETQNYIENVKYYVELFNMAGPVPFICSFIGGAINLAIRVVCALCADKAYKSRVVSACKQVRDSDDKDFTIRKVGGANLFAFGLAIFSVMVAVNLIAIFIM